MLIVQPQGSVVIKSPRPKKQLLISPFIVTAGSAVTINEIPECQDFYTLTKM